MQATALSTGLVASAAADAVSIIFCTRFTLSSIIVGCLYARMRETQGRVLGRGSVSEGARILIMDSDHNCALCVAAVNATVWHANYLLNTRKVYREGEGGGSSPDEGGEREVKNSLHRVIEFVLTFQANLWLKK